MAEPELKGQIRNVRFIHRAILNEAEDFRAVATVLDADDEQGPATLNQRLAAFERVLKLHEDAEDLGIFPALQAKYPYIADTYEYDHQRHREHLGALVSTLNELASARGGRRRDLVRLLGEQAVAFNAFMNLHIDKENNLLFPAYGEMFSAEEQMAHGQATEGRIQPQDMAAAGAWAFQRLQASDREEFLREMQAMLPPEAFAGLSKGMAAAVPASDWQEMVNRIPGLATPVA
jgi:hemerythrin-like domain-containing protein